MLTVICGPARCGKTERVLSRYREELGRRRMGSAVWLAPTQRAANELRERLLGGGLSVCLSPGVMTFDQFARQVIDASAHPIRPLRSTQKRQLVRRLIDQAAESEMTHFASIAKTSGMAELIYEFITDFKRLEIWPEELESACKAEKLSAKDRELHAIYAAYQKCLNDHRLYDHEGSFWWARELLEQGQVTPFANLRLVVADGFNDFTRTQHEILHILASRAAELIVTLTLEPPPERGSLFRKSRDTLDRLQMLHPGAAVEQMPRRTSTGWPAIEHVETELFKNPRHARPLANAERIEILAAPRPWGEIRLLGQRIKRLLTEGDAERAKPIVRPGEIAVVFRSLGETAPLVRDIFNDLGLPFAIEAGTPLLESRLIVALLNLVRLDIEDWPFRSVLAVLTNSYFRPAWSELASYDTLRNAERLIRRLQVPRGRRQLLDQVERLAALPDPEPDAPTDDAAVERMQRQAKLRSQAQQTLPLLNRLSETLEQLADRATPGQWGEALTQLAHATGLLRRPDEALKRKPARGSRRSLPGGGQGDAALAKTRAATIDPSSHDADERAWERLLGALHDGETLTRQIGEMPLQVARSELLNWLHETLRGEELPDAYSESGRIRVISAASARSLELPYLFFAGLSEKSFPSPDREDRLYNEAECRRLRALGLPLTLRAERSEEEMLLFYEVVTRATQRLYLSYPALDDKGQPLLASPFLTDLERCCGEGRMPRSVSLDLSPIPNIKEAVCWSDWRTAAVAEALDGKPQHLAGLQRNIEGGQSGSALLSALEVTASRQQRDKFGAYEGLLHGTKAIQELTSKYGPDHCWSVSHLDQYAYCPHQFFLERVLGLETLDELSLETDHGNRGWLLHETLATVHRRLNEELAIAKSPAAADDDRLLTLYRESLQAMLAANTQSDAVRAALQEVDRRLLLDWANRYSDQHRGYAEQWQGMERPPAPAHFEVSFGTNRKSSDPLSTTEPLRLKTAAGPVQFSGRIDRIDLGASQGQPVFVVLDYKSGHAPSRKEVHAARALQLPLYIIAVQELLLAAEKMLPWQAGYWQLRSGGYRPHIEAVGPSDVGSAASEEWTALRKSVLDRIGQLVHSVRAGNFPMISDDSDCTSRCQFRTVCRVNQVRSLEKQWPVGDGVG